VSILDFETKLTGNSAGANVRTVARDFPELIQHIRQMDAVLAERGSVAIADAANAAAVDVVVNAASGREVARFRWTITNEGLIWAHRLGVIRYPLVTDEAQKHMARDLWIRRLNQAVADAVNG
jgi:hypothetical protein